VLKLLNFELFELVGWPNDVVDAKLVREGEGDRVIDLSAGADESLGCSDSSSFECDFLLNRPSNFLI
jgi:hypothetical protein